MGSLLIRLLALLGVLWTGRHVIQQVSSGRGPYQNGDRPGTEGEIDGEMVKDPVCQTYIPKAIAFQQTVKGDIRYFCSEACALKFIEQPPSETP